MRNEERPARLPAHMPGLDGVRGLAILMVMAVHFVGNATPHNFPERIAIKLGSLGTQGVDLFFVLSGFLITGLLLDAKGGARYFRNFYARRTLRIFPLYYAALAGLFLLLPLFAALPPPLEEARTHQAWLWSYTANFFIAAKDSWALGYVSHFWSLAIEEHFYLVWPLVVFSVRRETLERVCLAVIAAGLGIRIALSLGGVSELAVSVLTPCRVDTLCVGALLAAVARREAGFVPLVARSGRAALALGAVTIALSAFGALTGLALPVLHQVRGTLFAVFFGALTLTSLQDPGGSTVARLFQGPTLRTFGKYSYGLYVYHGILAHHMLLLRTEDRLGAVLGSHAAGVAAQAVLGVTLSLVIAFLSYELFEKRLLQLKRHFESRPVAAAAPPALAAPSPEAAGNVSS